MFNFFSLYFNALDYTTTDDELAQLCIWAIDLGFGLLSFMFVSF